jgi:hypothetical protein
MLARKCVNGDNHVQPVEASLYKKIRTYLELSKATFSDSEFSEQ